MNRLSRQFVVCTLVAICAGRLARADDPTRVLENGRPCADSRLGRPRDLNGYSPFVPPVTREAWEARKKQLREQILVATGLWPMPERPSLDPVIHGRIERDAYTIEKVFFASYPGHYVSGNLYRPKGKPGKRPGVLSPHGHWRNGRFYEATEAEAQAQLKQGAEKTLAGARYPLQARCAQLARMGCIVFHYDMVGNADSRQIKHAAGFTDALAELRLQSFMGLQTYNSIRALDFLTSLPDVDPDRIGVTGASGGGTQTFILSAIDDRPTVAFPAVMVSTAMQGGCVCENCSYLRQGTGNVEFAALFAPKPLAMSGANDWTLEIETKGLPELKELYKLYQAADCVAAKCFPQFGHNYNQVSRELMYNWFNRHLQLGQAEPVREQSFVPVPPAELSVFDDDHPRPGDATNVTALRDYLTALSSRQLKQLIPQSTAGCAQFRETLGNAFRVMIQDELPAPHEVEATSITTTDVGGVSLEKLLLGRKEQGEQIPAVLLSPPGAKASVLIWIHAEGKSSLFDAGELHPLARSLLQKGIAILAPDVFRTGEFGSATHQEVDKKFAGFTYGYNRPLLANRVHDILTAVAFAQKEMKPDAIDLVGFEKAGPWALIARSLCANAVRRTVVDANQFDFAQVASTDDEMMLPGALKYGGLPTAAALAAPCELLIHNTGPKTFRDIAAQAYRAAGAASRLTLSSERIGQERIIDWLLPDGPTIARSAAVSSPQVSRYFRHHRGPWRCRRRR
jgi:dienelactone hydrolase